MRNQKPCVFIGIFGIFGILDFGGSWAGFSLEKENPKNPCENTGFLISHPKNPKNPNENTGFGVPCFANPVFSRGFLGFSYSDENPAQEPPKVQNPRNPKNPKNPSENTGFLISHPKNPKNPRENTGFGVPCFANLVFSRGFLGFSCSDENPAQEPPKVQSTRNPKNPRENIGFPYISSQKSQKSP